MTMICFFSYRGEEATYMAVQPGLTRKRTNNTGLQPCNVYAKVKFFVHYIRGALQLK